MGVERGLMENASLRRFLDYTGLASRSSVNHDSLLLRALTLLLVLGQVVKLQDHDQSAAESGDRTLASDAHIWSAHIDLTGFFMLLRSICGHFRVVSPPGAFQ